jgi:hypothetical protein
VQARPTTLALGETPEILLAGGAELGSIIAYNASAATVVYLKIWAGRSSAPSPATDTADFVFPCAPAGHTQIALFSQVNGTSYWAATNELGDGATAPDEDLVVTATYERLR